MLNFKVNGKLGEVILNLPTSINEFTDDYLKKVTESVIVADNYSLIALCHREKLANFILAGKNNKDRINTAVVPIFVKAGKITTSNCIINNIKTTSKLIISPSQLALGHHVNLINNTCTINKLIKYIDGDGYAYQNALKNNKEVYFLEFKIIPNCDIIGYYENEKFLDKNDNPFKIEEFKIF